jgi:hypothetical protein
MDQKLLKTLQEHYPFMTLCLYAGVEYIGIIQNRDEAVTTIYDFGTLQDTEMKKIYLDLAAAWWWESNRSIPINIFLKTEWEPFRDCLKTFSNRDLEILHGPVCSLNDISRRKSKRRSITLVKKPY